MARRIPLKAQYVPGAEELTPPHLTEAERDAWLRFWIPEGEDGRVRRLAVIAGYRVAPDGIGVFVEQRSGDAGVCAVPCSESAGQVEVGAVAFTTRKRGYPTRDVWPWGHELVSVPLAAPLGDRAVVSCTTGDPIERYELQPWPQHWGSRWWPASAYAEDWFDESREIHVDDDEAWFFDDADVTRWRVRTRRGRSASF